MKKLACLVLALAGLALTSCTTPTGRFLEDRGRDLLDVLPMSIAGGKGLYVGARATEFIGVGAGYNEATRFGWPRRRQYGGEELDIALGGYLEWPEEVWGAMVAWERTDDPLPGAGNTAVFVPMRNLPHPQYTHWWGTLLDVEIDVFLGFLGVRIAASPVQFVDFLLGWGKVDFLEDDMNAIEDAGDASQ